MWPFHFFLSLLFPHRGFWGGYVKEYIEASHPAFCIGEYWDSLAYDGGAPAYNQSEGHTIQM